MSESHYSLRWNNHQRQIVAAFDALFQARTLLDVTLVCRDRSVWAHKVVLSACSPFFQRILQETPCKHPVIVLKDFNGWEVEAIVDFMYKGEISVMQEQLQALIRAAENLQVRGLAHQENMDKDSSTASNQAPTPSTSPVDHERNFFANGRFPTPGVTARSTEVRPSFSPVPVPSVDTSSLRLPHMAQLQFPEMLLPRQGSQSPIPRRKQARPRRRSGEMCGVQDLTTNTPKNTTEETAENLSLKKPNVEDKQCKDTEPAEKSPTPDNAQSPELNLSMQNQMDASPSLPSLPPVLNMAQEMESQQQMAAYPQMPALAMSPHNKFYDPHIGLYASLEGCRSNPFLEAADPRCNPDPQLYVKKKMGRPKGQHSAPRGGPPRSWTNNELTTALAQVWNKRMTTSQASRVYGIPYNSLLMYVRGKYGKSLKLEQLRKDCIGGVDSMDLINSSNNNNSCKLERELEQSQQNTRPPSREEVPHPSMFNPFMANFHPEFAGGFPIPVNMLSLFPQSEKNRDHNQINSEEDCKSLGVKKEMEEEPQDLFRPPSISREERRELVQQNGQD